MPGIPTHFKNLELTIEKLKASPDAHLQSIAQVMADNSVYAYLGAIGPTLADFIPSEPSEPGSPSGNQYLEILKRIFEVVGGDGTELNPGLLSILTRMNSFLDRAEAAANAEDLDALRAMEDEIDDINQTAEGLANVVTQVEEVAPIIASMIGTGLKPLVHRAPAGSPLPPPEVWAVRNFLHWKRPGRFAQALLQRAQAESDSLRRNQFLAYVYGYLTSYAGKVCGSPFINSIVCGPYRTQWWRHRWINNYVDAWVYGFYETAASMAGDIPNPSYDEWANLCDAKLQEKLELPGIDPVQIMECLRRGEPFPQVFPSEFGEFWFNAFSDAYGAPPEGSYVEPEALNGAYLMTWMVLWFQTSGEVLGCITAEPESTDDCGEVPSWTDPTTPGDADGSGSRPPSPGVETDVDEGQVASGIILAILGALFFLGGGLVSGAASIAGGIGLILSAVDVNWENLRCDLYWYRLYLYNGLNALHEILTLGGLAYPYTSELADDETVIEISGLNLRFDSGRNVVKSRRLPDGFPAAPWGGFLSTWIFRPTNFENPQQVAYLTEAYPSFFVNDDAANPLGNGEVRIGSTWPFDGDPWPFRARPGSNTPIQFGNAVDNSVDLLAHLEDDFPDWNLDADRGLAFFTWQFRGGIYTDPVSIEPEA